MHSSGDFRISSRLSPRTKVRFSYIRGVLSYYFLLNLSIDNQKPSTGSATIMTSTICRYFIHAPPYLGAVYHRDKKLQVGFGCYLLVSRCHQFRFPSGFGSIRTRVFSCSADSILCASASRSPRSCLSTLSSSARFSALSSNSVNTST